MNVYSIERLTTALPVASAVVREIKFRAWDGTGMQYGGFSIHATGKIEPIKGLSPITQESPIMQYTGINDKDGKEIYEGDIIECKFHPMWYERISWEGKPDAICEVYYDYCGFGLKVKGEKDYRYTSVRKLLEVAEHKADLLARMAHAHCKVIGNIYDATP
jgi:uncharacterized phage protein (TIGR01671 family)